MQDFDHRRLAVYGLAVDFAKLAERVTGAARGVHPNLADQLRRAAASICLNLAEGAGEYRSAEKARLYRIARRSAAECAAVLDLCRALGLAPAPLLDACEPLLRSILAMLTRLILNRERDASA